MSQEQNQPVKEFRVGGIRAAIWKREVTQNGRTFTRFSTRIQKQYRDKSGQWRNTNIFLPRDLPDLALVAQKTFEFVRLRETERPPSS